jgi:formate--tetrahydrofolate ligase
MELKKIWVIAKKAGLGRKDLMLYGDYKAKIEPRVPAADHNAKLILVTAITPTKAGEGKTTTSIALADAFTKMGKKTIVALREPSLGPVFGQKGGAAGGGKVTVEPAEDINLHFTGDMHALTSSINLVAAIIDNSIFQGNPLDIDPERIIYPRALDMNDRSLREITVGQGPIGKSGKALNGTPHKSQFVITVAHEMMAVLCLAKDADDFKERIGKITVAYTHKGDPVTIKDLKVTNAVMHLMKYALMPNLVQTSNGTPAIIHGGPFANIAHGCNSIIATKTALSLADYVFTEAGFGSDLGAEKFLDIKCQVAGLKPDLVVMVATIRALKEHGGVKFEDLTKEDVAAMERGLPNLEKHVENMKKFGMDVLVNINKFASDSPKEVKALEKWCEEKGYPFCLNDAYAKGPKGAMAVGKKALEMLSEAKSNYHPLVTKNMTIEEKITKICTEIYGAAAIEYSDKAKADLQKIHQMGYDSFFVCMAKTQMSLTDDPKVLGAPTGFTIHIRNIEIATGARFVIPVTGTIFRMPGLPALPLAVEMEDEK